MQQGPGFAGEQRRLRVAGLVAAPVVGSGSLFAPNERVIDIHVLAQTLPPGAARIEEAVAGDLEQVGPERCPARLVVRAAADELQPGLLGQVLGLGEVACAQPGEEVVEGAVVAGEELRRRFLHDAARHQQHQVLVGKLFEPAGRVLGRGFHECRRARRQSRIIA